MAVDGVTPLPVQLTAPLPRSLVRPAKTSEERMVEALERIAAALERWVKLNDPAEPVEEPGTPLPEDFPGREALAEAGVVCYVTLPRTGVGLAALGLDGPTVNQVLTRLKRDGDA